MLTNLINLMKKVVYLFFALTLFSACQDDPVTPSVPTPDPPAPTPTSYYISFTMDGVNYSYAQGQNNYAGGTSTGGSFGGSSDPCTVETGAFMMKYDDDDAPSASIEFLENFYMQGSEYYDDKSGALANITAIGSRIYTTEDSGIQGVRFVFNNGPSNRLSSDDVTQPGTSGFQVTNSVDKTDMMGVKREVTGTFNCTVGGNKSITNGQFRLIFETY